MTGRRRALMLLAGATVSAAGCGGTDGRPIADDPFCRQVMPAVDSFMAEARAEHPTPDDPRYGGTVVVASYGELVGGMNTASTADETSSQHQRFVGLMPLLRYDENIELQPYLAESWELAPDMSSVTFHLRRDVYWHDGVQTTARDVAFTYEVVTDPATAFPNPSFWDYYVRGPEGVEILDDFTVRIHLRPHSEPLDPFWRVGILPEHLLGDVPHSELARHPYGTLCPVGNGPFVFFSHIAQDRWTFEANPAFPEALGGRPFVDRYIYRIIQEQTTLLTELLTEDIDVYDAPAPDQAQAILDDPSLYLVRAPTRQYNFVGWNARRPQLADSRVRKALTLATDREQMVAAIVQGYGSVANGGIPPWHWAYDPDAPVLPYDPDSARALLDDAGWIDRDGDGVRESEDGTRFSISIKYNTGNDERRDIAEIMQSELAAVGVEAQPQSVEWGTLIDQFTDPSRRDFDGIAIGWVNEFRIDDTELFHSAHVDEPFALSGTQNPEIDRLIDTLAVTVDRDAAKRLWREYQRAVFEEQPYTYVYFPERLLGVNRRVQGLIADTRGELVDIKDWYLADR